MILQNRRHTGRGASEMALESNPADRGSPIMGVADRSVINKVIDKLIRDKRKLIMVGGSRHYLTSMTFVGRYQSAVCLRRDIESAESGVDPGADLKLIVPSLFGAILLTLNGVLVEDDRVLRAKTPSRLICLRKRAFSGVSNTKAKDYAQWLNSFALPVTASSISTLSKRYP